MTIDEESRVVSYVEKCIFKRRGLPTPNGLLSETGINYEKLKEGSPAKATFTSLCALADPEKAELFDKIAEHRDQQHGFELLKYLVAQIELLRGVRALGMSDDP